MSADLSNYRTCAIAVPDHQKNSNVSDETIVGAIGGTPVSSAAHAVVTKLDQLWKAGATVTYSFLDGTANQQNKVKSVASEWYLYANLKFELAAAGTVGQLRISFDPRLGSWSYVGKVNQQIANSQATMNLGWVEDTESTSNDDRGVILHEFGHALGLLHEHQSPARGGTITLDEDAVYAYYAATQGWDKDTIKAQILTRRALFDPQSVMLYADKAYVTSVGKKTGLNPYPSPTDLDLLRLIYPDSGSKDGKFAAALDAFSFTPEDKKTLLQRAKDAVGSDGSKVSEANVGVMWADIALNFKNNPGRLSTTPVASNTLNALNAILPPLPVITPPLRDVGGPTAGGTVSSASAPGFIYELLDALKQFFNPGGNQMFTLQFPGRFLDQGSYAWDTSLAGVYGQFVKPTAVNEAEFRLVDQLYDLAPTVGGPNGTNLSIVYEQVLNNLLPRYVENGLAKQQDQIRHWLMKDVPMSGWIQDIMKRQQSRESELSDQFSVSMGLKPTTSSTSGTAVGPVSPTPANGLAPGKMFDVSSKSTANGETLNRIELSELLMNEYLYAKQDWELERDALIAQANQADLGSPESQKALNELTRKLAHITATRQAQLAAKYSDAVVRGYSHTVREYMGYLDIASPAEGLQNAKDSLRESAMSSLDGSMKVYPIQLTPLDWFEGLSTSFTMEDLTQDPEVIRQQINAKSQQIDILNSQLVALQMGAHGDPTELKQKVKDAQTALDSAQSALAQQYSNNVIAMANTCIDAKGKFDTSTLAGKLGVAKDVLARLPDQMAAVRTAQDNLTASSRALSQMMAALALAQATDTKQQQQQLTLQIQSLTGELNELQTRWQTLTATTGGVNPPTAASHDGDQLPTTPLQLPQENSSGGSRWQTITLRSDTSTREKVALQHSDASSEQWSVNLWLASGSGSSSSSSASSSDSSAGKDDTIELAFRATLVTVDRGGWFQPQFFKESKAFYKVNKDISWADDKANGVNGLLPGFPVAFLIAKDIVVRVTHSASASADSKQVDASNSASSGGFLCFSYSTSKSSSSEATASSFQSFANGFMVPGPQILGYMIQKTDPDEAQPMPTSLPSDFFIPDEDYNNAVNGTGNQPANGVNPQPAHDLNTGAGGAAAVPAPAITQEKLREVLSSMLNDKLGDLFSHLSPAVPAPTS